MREAGWSARKVARQFGRSDCVVASVDPRDVIYIKTGLRTPSTDQSSRRSSHHWTATKWNQIVYSDEYRFNLSSDATPVRVWSPRGERLNPAFALQQRTAPTSDVMAWSAIAYEAPSPLNIDPWHNDSPVVRPCHPSATHCRDPRSHFSTRKFSATHSKKGCS
ncbi:transposable element Tcb2 transposase [Trichonephila clavipes]|nr:transposable element Tcb2 transposase [Trichonephila clavipes]